MNTAQLTTAAMAIAFILGGDARFTFVSKATGARYTYQVSRPNENHPFYVLVLTGSNNETDYQYLGTIFDRKHYRHGRKSRIAEDAPSARAFAWGWAKLSAGVMPEKLEVWHEGRCCRCGRLLTTPKSVASGIGPVCAEKAA